MKGTSVEDLLMRRGEDKGEADPRILILWTARNNRGPAHFPGRGRDSMEDDGGRKMKR